MEQGKPRHLGLRSGFLGLERQSQDLRFCNLRKKLGLGLGLGFGFRRVGMVWVALAQEIWMDWDLVMAFATW